MTSFKAQGQELDSVAEGEERKGYEQELRDGIKEGKQSWSAKMLASNIIWMCCPNQAHKPIQKSTTTYTVFANSGHD